MRKSQKYRCEVSLLNFWILGIKKDVLRRLFTYSMVPKAGIEPARLAAVDFESTASTDFATSALK